MQIIIFIIDYEACFTPIKATCANEYHLGQKQNVDYEACKNSCNQDSTCKFIYHFSNNKYCHKYSSCDRHRIPNNAGVTYSKEANCPSKNHN